MELITENLIMLDENADTKEHVIELFSKLLKKEHRLEDECLFQKDVFKREEQAPTSIGNEIAIPHAISSSIKDASLIFIRLNHEVRWNDEDMVKYIFGIAVPQENKDNQHLKILSSLARHMLDESFKERILQAKTKSECITLLNCIHTSE